MSDKGIIFAAPMVRALLDGTKTQTRRLLNPQPETFAIDDAGTPCEVGCMQVEGEPYNRIFTGRVLTTQKVHYATGDRLYVRENWQALTHGDFLPTKSPISEVRYAATDPLAGVDKDVRGYSWRPCIHMPRWASRLTLAVTEVRVQRLQEVSEEDAFAEGVRRTEAPGEWYDVDDRDTSCVSRDPVRCYRNLWNSLHTAAGETWDDNPWVVAVSFDVRPGNIDAEAK